MQKKALVLIDIQNEICDFYIAGADAVVCVKSTCYNLRKAN